MQATKTSSRNRAATKNNGSKAPSLETAKGLLTKWRDSNPLRVTPDARFEKVPLFSSREYEVFCNLGRGWSTAEIARSPGHRVSVKTIECQVNSLRHKTGLSKMARLRVLAALYLDWLEREGLVRVPNMEAKWTFRKRQEAVA